MAELPQELFPVVTFQDHRTGPVWHMAFGLAEDASTGQKLQPLKRGDVILTVGVTPDGKEHSRTDTLGPEFIDGSTITAQVFLGQPPVPNTIVLWKKFKMPVQP